MEDRKVKVILDEAESVFYDVGEVAYYVVAALVDAAYKYHNTHQKSMTDEERAELSGPIGKFMASLETDDIPEDVNIDKPYIKLYMTVVK